MILTLPTAINIVAAVIILVRSLIVLNEMGRNTRPPIRMGYILLSIGAFVSLIDPIFHPSHTGWPEVAINCGIACIILANRRKTALSVVPTRAMETGDDHTVYMRKKGVI